MEMFITCTGYCKGAFPEITGMLLSLANGRGAVLMWDCMEVHQVNQYRKELTMRGLYERKGRQDEPLYENTFRKERYFGCSVIGFITRGNRKVYFVSDMELRINTDGAAEDVIPISSAKPVVLDNWTDEIIETMEESGYRKTDTGDTECLRDYITSILESLMVSVGIDNFVKE